MIHQDTPIVIIGRTEEPDVIEAKFAPGTFWDKPAETRSQAVGPFRPSVEDSAVRVMTWPERLGSLSLTQLLLGLSFFVDVRSIGYFGQSDDGMEKVQFGFDEFQLEDEGWRSLLRDGFRQGLQAKDVVLQFS